jgi:maleylpyruvate isomerase
VDRPTDQIAACAASHARLRKQVNDLSDSDVRGPSLLPGWSLGHLLTHLARNADSVVRRLEAAARGELVDQYPGGSAGRAAAIDEGAGRSAAALIEDVTTASEAVDEAFANLDDDCWDRPSRDGSGFIHPVAVLPYRRWREVEVHMVDLGRGYSPTQWPIELVDLWLPDALAQLPNRTDPRLLLAWTLRRGNPPSLQPW